MASIAFCWRPPPGGGSLIPPSICFWRIIASSGIGPPGVSAPSPLIADSWGGGGGGGPKFPWPLGGGGIPIGPNWLTGGFGGSA